MKTIFSFLMALFLINEARAQDWRTATRDSAGLAPDPQDVKEAVVQVYAARTVDWRGYFAVHSWIATKEKDATEYTTYQVIGWRVRRGQEAVAVQRDIPDRHWFGAKPDLIADLRGEKAEQAIPQIQGLSENYKYKDVYRAYPGPNSNTYISHIIRNVKEIGVELPPHAIGKDWINDGSLVGWSETGTGVQVSLWGLLGFTVGLSDGVELNILGLSFGVDLLRPRLRSPWWDEWG